MNFDPTPHMMDLAQTYAEMRFAAAGEEACGVMFYPDRRFALGIEKPTVPRFVPIANSHDPAAERGSNFAFNYSDIEHGVLVEYGGHPSGFIQLWHSHLADLGPSGEDYAMVALFETAMADHPWWHPTSVHKIICLESSRWIDYTSTFAANTFVVSTMQGH